MTKIDKNDIKRIYNYSLRSLAAFCSARNDLKTLCLKLAYGIRRNETKRNETISLRRNETKRVL